MPQDKFWGSNLSAYYIEKLAYEQTQELKVQEIDILAWKNGAYSKNVFESTPILCGLIDEKAINILPKYPTKPLCLKDVDTVDSKPIKKRKINNTPPTPEEIAEYNAKMLMLKNK